MLHAPERRRRAVREGELYPLYNEGKGGENGGSRPEGGGWDPQP